MKSQWTNLVGIARRAGNLFPGENQVTNAMKHQLVRLIILAADAGPSLYRKYHLWAQDLSVPIVQIGTKVELGHAIGMGPHAVVAISDAALAEKILEQVKSAGGIILGRQGQRQGQGLRAGERAQARQSSAHRSPSSIEGRRYQKSHEHRGAGSGENREGHHGRETSARTQTGSQTATGGHRYHEHSGTRRGSQAGRPATTSPNHDGAARQSGAPPRTSGGARQQPTGTDDQSTRRGHDQTRRQPAVSGTKPRRSSPPSRGRQPKRS